MIEKAVEKFSPPCGDNSGSAAHLKEDGGVAAHGPGYPGSGILEEKE